MSRRMPISISLNVAELHKLDTWAAHHDMNRSEAVRSLIIGARLPNQAKLELEFAHISDIDPPLKVERHHKECTEAMRERHGRSNPFHKVFNWEPCRVCWPIMPPTPAEAQALKRQLEREGTTSDAPAWALWAALHIDSKNGGPTDGRDNDAGQPLHQVAHVLDGGND